MTTWTKLSETAVGKIKPPAKGRDYYRDNRTPGLSLCVYATGAKVFEYVGDADGRTMRLTLGRHPSTSVGQARVEAVKLAGDVARGVNPADCRRRGREEPTVGDAWADMLARHLKPRRRAKTIHEYTLLWTKYLSTWATRKLSAVKRRDVMTLHARVGKDAPYQANRIIALAHKLYEHAGKNLGFAGPNPAADIEPFPEESRARYLEPAELPAFFKAVQETPDVDLRDFVLLLLFTGARRSNLLAMQADELDLRRAIWSIPAGKAKKGRPMTVHLPHPAMEILAGRLERVEGNYLFPPNRGGGKSPHWIDPIPRWRRLCKAAGLAGLRLHDLRRTLGSWAAAGGSSLLVIGKALGHIDPKTTETYARLNIDPIRVAVDGAVNAMLAVGRPPVALPALSPAD